MQAFPCLAELRDGRVFLFEDVTALLTSWGRDDVAATFPLVQAAAAQWAKIEALVRANVEALLVRRRRLRKDCDPAETIVTRRRHALLLLHVMELAPHKTAREAEFQRLVVGPDWAQLPSRLELLALDDSQRKRLRPELHLRNRQKRLMHLTFQTTDAAWDGTGEAPTDDLRGVQKLEDVVAGRLPQWAAGLRDVVVIPRDSWRGDVVVQRCQKFGSCYMQSAGVLVHYIIRRNLYGRDGTTVGIYTPDLTTYMLRRVAKKVVWAFISEDSGGNTLPLLRNLAGLGRGDIIKQACANCVVLVGDGEIVDLLRQYGPALVSTMDMNDTEATGIAEELGNPAMFVHVGSNPVQDPVTQWHSVLLIGYRTEPAATPGGVPGVRYLIQNWWGFKQFFEVDLAFLSSRQAELAWVTNTGLTALPAGTVLCNGLISASMPFGRAACPDPLTRGTPVLVSFVA